MLIGRPDASVSGVAVAIGPKSDGSGSVTLAVKGMSTSPVAA